MQFQKLKFNIDHHLEKIQIQCFPLFCHMKIGENNLVQFAFACNLFGGKIQCFGA